MIYTAIDNFYVTDEQLLQSPSRKNGVDEDTEGLLRLYGAELIQTAGILLKLPQVVMATGQVLFHRFYCKKSFTRFNVKGVAASALWLASKLEESPRKVRDVIYIFYRLNQRQQGLPTTLLEPLSQEYAELKTELIRTERHLLKEMGFICHVEHPHKFIFNYLSQLEVTDPAVKQEAWNLANDSLRTALCVRLKSEVVACGVIHAAVRRAGIPLPENPSWWLGFDADKKDIDEVCRVLAELYKKPKAHYIEVNQDAEFIRSTRAWEPPPDLPGLEKLMKQGANGRASATPPLPPPPPGAGASAQPVEVNGAQTVSNGAGQVPAAVVREEAEDVRDPHPDGPATKSIPEKPIDHPGDVEAAVISDPGDVKDAKRARRSKSSLRGDSDDGGAGRQDRRSRDVERGREKERSKEREREREREKEKEAVARESVRDSARAWDRDGEREKDRAKAARDGREREGERERSREVSRPEPSRPYAAVRGRDSEYQGSHILVREKDRSHRHHPYDRPKPHSR